MILLDTNVVVARTEPFLLEEINDRSGFLEEILKTDEIIYSADKLQDRCPMD
mgnify:CR=1 FL=1